MTAATSGQRITDRQLRIAGLRIHVQISGEGEPLLLHSPLWGEAALWEPLLAHLPGFRAIAFDPPGFGRSQTPACPLTMWTLAGFGPAVLDELGIDSAHVLGMSFGGTVAQQMAISYPSRVRRLVLASTSFGAFGVPGSPVALWHMLLPWTYRAGRLERAAGTMFGGRMRAEPELARTMHVRRPEDLWAAWSTLAPLFGWTSLPWLWTIRHPALVLCGDDDPIAPHLNHRILAALIPRGRLHTIRGGGHLVLLDSPSRVAPVISGFLGAGARQSAGRAA